MRVRGPRGKEQQQGWSTLAFSVLPLLLVVTGCQSLEYPTNWPTELKAMSGMCPDLSGTYVNAGSLAGSCSAGLQGLGVVAAWNCDASLAGNLVKMTPIDVKDLRLARSVESITLQQPDQDTLEIHFPSTSAMAPRIFKRSKGHFECGAAGMTYSMKGSTFMHEDTPAAMGEVATTAVLLGSATGLIDTTVRAFRRLQDGSVLMDVRESSVGVSLLLPVGWKSSNFVRWTPQEGLPNVDRPKGSEPSGN
jgi:hypothetical protein